MIIQGVWVKTEYGDSTVLTLRRLPPTVTSLRYRTAVLAAFSEGYQTRAYCTVRLISLCKERCFEADKELMSHESPRGADIIRCKNGPAAFMCWPNSSGVIVRSNYGKMRSACFLCASSNIRTLPMYTLRGFPSLGSGSSAGSLTTYLPTL